MQSSALELLVLPVILATGEAILVCGLAHVLAVLFRKASLVVSRRSASHARGLGESAVHLAWRRHDHDHGNVTQAALFNRPGRRHRV